MALLLLLALLLLALLLITQMLLLELLLMLLAADNATASPTSTWPDWFREPLRTQLLRKVLNDHFEGGFIHAP